MLEFTFKVVAQPKRSVQTTRSGHTFTHKKDRAYRNFLKQLIKTNYLGKPLTGPLKATVVFTFVPPKSDKKRKYPYKKPDIDNLCKNLFDPMSGVLWKDDAQIVKLEAEKAYGEVPSIYLKVEELS